MARSRVFLLIFGGVFFLTSAVKFVQYFSQPADIWWTPKALAVPLVESSDRVEIYVRDVGLVEQIKGDRLRVLGDGGATPVTKSDVRLRFNNWDRIRAQRMGSLLGAAVALGASAVFLLFGILDWGPKRLGVTP